MKEFWKDIEGYKGFYQVSNLGRIKSKMLKNEYIMKKSIDSRGYEQVKFFDKKTFLVHHLVLNAFDYKRISKDYHCNHINGIKTDNQVENLEWVTRSQNMIHAYKNGLNHTDGKKGEDHPLVKLTEKQVLEIRSSNLKNTELSKIYNVNHKTISKIKLKQRWKHL